MANQTQPIAWRPRLRPSTSRRGAVASSGLTWLVLIVFILIGITVLLGAIYSTAVVTAGRTVSGQVIDRYWMSGKGAGYRVRYTYNVDGRDYNSEERDQNNSGLHVGSSVPVRIAPWWPSYGAAIATSTDKLQADCMVRWLFALGWNAVVYACLISFVRGSGLRQTVRRQQPSSGRDNW